MLSMLRHIKGAVRLSKRLLLLTLCLVGMRMGIYPQNVTPTLTPSQAAISATYSIDPAKQYEGYLVIKAIDAILLTAQQEALAQSKSAWDMGYKQGVLDWKPQSDGWKAKSDFWEARALKAENLLPYFFWGGLGTSAVTFVAGALIFHH